MSHARTKGRDKSSAFPWPGPYYFKFCPPSKLSRPPDIRYRDNSQLLDSMREQKYRFPPPPARERIIIRYVYPSEIHRGALPISISDFNLMPSRYLKHDLPIPISCYRTFRDMPRRAPPRRARGPGQSRRYCGGSNPHHEYSSALTTSSISLRFQCRRVRSRSSTKTRPDGAR